MKITIITVRTPDQPHFATRVCFTALEPAVLDMISLMEADGCQVLLEQVQKRPYRMRHEREAASLLTQTYLHVKMAA